MPTQTAVMFDMDGLLLDTERPILECFVETRRAFGLSDSPETFLRCVGLRGDQTHRIILDSLAGQADYRAFNLEWDKRISKRFKEPIHERPGASQLLAHLADQGALIGVATSTKTKSALDHLDRVGLLPFIQHVVGGDAVTRSKPDPEPYITLASRLGVAPSECIAFEDSEAGTLAAIASGAVTVQVPDLVPPSEKMQANGHVIAPDLLTGAAIVGLIEG